MPIPRSLRQRLTHPAGNEEGNWGVLKKRKGKQRESEKGGAGREGLGEQKVGLEAVATWSSGVARGAF